MSEELPPVRCDDPTTWRHKGEKIDLPRLLQLIEENDGSEGLDLHSADLSRLDARPETLRPHIEAYREEHGADATPPWLAWNFWTETGGLNLREAHLEDANLFATQLQGADLLGAHLENAFLHHAHLENARLVDAHLENATLVDAHLENAWLLGAYLENARLVGAHLENARLVAAHLENADLQRAGLRSVTWYSARLDRTRLRREQMGPAIGDELAAKGQISFRHPTFREASEAYLALKTNFDSIGRYEDASWAYVKEQQMEKAMHFPTTAGHKWIRECMGGTVPPPRWGPRRLPRWLRWKLRSAFYHARLFFGFLGLCPREVRQSMGRRDERGQERDEWLTRRRWARNWAYELLTGYGEWPHMPVIWAAVVVLLFALIYAVAGNIAAGDVGALKAQPTHSPITALVHSISAFATIGFNTLEPQGWGARLLTALEAMFGIGLFALFVFTLGNRMRRS